MPAPVLDVVTETVRFPAGEHVLEGELAYPEEGRPCGAAVLAGPHPLLGGSRHNNVIRALGDGLAQRGLATLRFDYRAAGGTLAEQMTAFWQAPHDQGEHAEDLAAAVGFLRQVLVGPVPLALIGYSFGCSLLPRAVGAADPAALVLIAPTAGRHDLEGFVGLSVPRLVIAPRGDFAADETHLEAWLSRLAGTRQLVRPVLDGHFFRGSEDELEGIVAAFLDLQWSECP
jgi:alpha/beta superfamily hydrolase